MEILKNFTSLQTHCVVAAIIGISLRLITTEDVLTAGVQLVSRSSKVTFQPC